tara:strand:- start:1327 stop:1722 length:396 start_codon:yes stop_codon:yes gene_type:complete
MTKQKESHNKQYYEKGRNGYIPKDWKDEVIEDKNNKWVGGEMNNKELNFDWHLDKVSCQIINLLKEKNAAYGNTALNPPNIFSKLNSTEAICARLDDKLSRIKNKGIDDKTEDTVDDLIGYLFLLKMSLEK